MSRNILLFFLDIGIYIHLLDPFYRITLSWHEENLPVFFSSSILKLSANTIVFSGSCKLCGT